MRQIVQNAGGEGSVVVSKVLEGADDYGFNAKSGEYVKMLEAGIIDPTKVTRVALENAASVAGMILTTACALVDIKTEGEECSCYAAYGWWHARHDVINSSN